MLTSEDAEQAVQILPGKSLGGRPLKASSCVQKGSTDSRSYSTRLQSTRWRNQSQAESTQHQDHSIASRTATDLLIPFQENRRLFVGGLPCPVDNHTSDLEIRDLFKDFHVECVSKVKSPQKKDARGNAWYAFVDLSTAEEASRASRVLNRKKLWGGTITVNLARGSPGKVLDTLAKEEQDRSEDVGSETD